MTTREHSSAELADVAEDLRTWRQMHPRATFTEIEVELDQRLQAARAALLAEMAGTTASGPGICPDCGDRLVRRGRQTRTVITTGDELVTIERTYAHCPHCGSGLFPPG